MGNKDQKNTKEQDTSKQTTDEKNVAAAERMNKGETPEQEAKTVEKDGEQKTVETEEGKTVETDAGGITVNVNTKDKDEDPSKDQPIANHVEGTAGLVGTAAGAAQVRASHTGNETADDITARPATNQAQVEGSTGEESQDIRDLRPSAVEEKRKEEAEKNPEDYGTEINGEKTEEQNIQTASKEAYNALAAGKGSAILLRDGERVALFTTEDYNGQKKVVIKPEDVDFSDDEAAVLNSYNQRILTGPLS